jgi:tetratricopeptide (TPR) repeat protein
MSIKFRDERKRVVRLLRDGLEKLEAGDAAGALLEFESALLFDEDNVAASCLAAASLSRLGRSTEGEALALRAIELAPDFSFSHAVAAEVLFALEKYSEAEAHLMEAVSIEPHNPGPMIELARFLILRDRPQEAGEHLRRSLEISPELAEARLLFAASLSQQGRWEDADLEIELVSRIRRVDATSLAVAAWLRMSRADDLNFSAPKLEEFKRALELLTTAHAIEPSNQLVQELLPICREAVARVGKPADAEFSPPSRLRQGLIALGLILYVVLFGVDYCGWRIETFQLRCSARRA